MSKFRIKKITIGKVSRKHAIKNRIVKTFPFLKGFFCGAVVVGFYMMCTLTNAESIHTKQFIALADPKRLIEMVNARNLIAEVQAEDAKTVIEGVTEGERAYAKRILEGFTAVYFGESEVEAMSNIIKNESGFNPAATNKTSGACGLGQALPCAKMQCEKHDVLCQVTWVMNYTKERYGTPTKAWKHWQAKVKINGENVGNWW